VAAGHIPLPLLDVLDYAICSLRRPLSLQLTINPPLNYLLRQAVKVLKVLLMQLPQEGRGFHSFGMRLAAAWT
jgi:hypothetical protein